MADVSQGTVSRGTGALLPRRKTGRESPGIQSVERAARMLSLFTVEQPELSLTELTQQMGMSKATVHRYASTLRKTGLLRFTSGRYTLGPRIVELSAPALAGLEVIKVAPPHLERLVEQTAQTALLSVWDGTAPVVVLIEDNTGRAIRIGVARGRRLPLTSAEGMVFRAFMADYLPGPELEEIYRERIAFFEDVAQGLVAYAAPVFQGENIVAAMALVGTAGAMRVDDHALADSRMALTLRDAADALSAELGFRPSRPLAGWEA